MSGRLVCTTFIAALLIFAARASAQDAPPPEEKEKEQEPPEDPEKKEPVVGIDRESRPGVITHDQERLPWAYLLRQGAILDPSLDFLFYDWGLFLGNVRARVGPGRHKEEAEQGFFEARPVPGPTGWWPLWERVVLPDAPEKKDGKSAGLTGKTTRTHLLWPFVTWERGPKHKVLNFRPLFRYERRPGFKSVRALWPIFHYRRTGENRLAWIFPISRFKRFAYRKSDGSLRSDVDAFFLPFFWGTDTEEGAYFALFPVGGMIKGILGKKWVRFFLWPLYAEANEKNYHSWNILWPIFGYWRGEKQSGWRFWPLYGRNTWPNRFDRRFFLWPLFHWWHVGQDTDREMKAFLFFPFYGRMNIKNRLNYWNFLLLFSGRRKPKRHFRELHLPWPIYSYTRADGLYADKLWPLYGHRVSNSVRHRFVLWPLYRFRYDRKETSVRRNWSLAWLFNFTTTEWIETLDKTGSRPRVRRTPPPRGRTDRWIDDPRKGPKQMRRDEASHPTREQGRLRRSKTVSFYPLFFWRRGPQGGVVFRALNLLPTRDTGAFASAYMPFTILYHYQRSADGVKESRALLGLYRHKSTPVERQLNAFGLFDYNRHGNREEGKEGISYRRFQILKGLFGYERLGKRRRLKILWIPTRIFTKKMREEERRKADEVRLKYQRKAQETLARKMTPPEFDWKKKAGGKPQPKEREVLSTQ